MPASLIEIAGETSDSLLFHGLYWPPDSERLIADPWGAPITRGEFIGVYRRGALDHGAWGGQDYANAD